jgi:hypothetical protein
MCVCVCARVILFWVDNVCVSLCVRACARARVCMCVSGFILSGQEL